MDMARPARRMGETGISERVKVGTKRRARVGRRPEQVELRAAQCLRRLITVLQVIVEPEAQGGGGIVVDWPAGTDDGGCPGGEEGGGYRQRLVEVARAVSVRHALVMTSPPGVSGGRFRA